MSTGQSANQSQPRMIEADNLSVQLGERRALDGVDLACDTGEFICVLGANGAGKTTLLKAIAGLVPHGGRVRLQGRDTQTMKPGERGRLVGYLPQGHHAHWPITAREAVAIGRIPHGATPGRPTLHDEQAIARALEATDATALASRPITELSGGERARVMLARALAVEARILLADEPISALDPAHQLAVMELLAQTAARGITVLAALHDLTLAARYATRVVVLVAGRIAADGPPRAVLSPALLATAFGITALHLEHDGAPVLVSWTRIADSGRSGQ